MNTSINTKALLLTMLVLTIMMFFGAAKLAFGNVETKVKTARIAEASTEMIFLENGEYMVINK